MTATVKIMPGAIYVFNEDTFPWYGLIITINDRYSTKYRFGDRNWGFLSKDSILHPKDDIGPSITAFIDKNDNEYEGELYTIIATDVTLEVKTRVDGPYDLKATFDFSKEDPIFEHGIWRTNKPTDPSVSHATPYPLSDPNALVQQPTPTQTPITPQDETARLRWQEQWEHWKNIDAFKASMQEINADRIISKEESKHICFALEQWTTQMNAAKQYVIEYREFDPERAALPSVYKIKEEADRILELLSQAECVSPLNILPTATPTG